MMHPGNWYTINGIDAIDSPALVVYKQRVIQNIQEAIKLVNNVTYLRPHVKTNKISEVCKLMMDAGITKFKCATIAEAEMLAMLQATDVLLAYQPIGPKAYRFINLVKQYSSTNFSCIVDNLQVVEELSQIAEAQNVQLSVFIDVNVGMNRTGAPIEEIVNLYDLLNNLPNIRVRGLHAYDGHIRDTNIEVRKSKCDAVFAAVESLRKCISDKHLINQEGITIIMGGSPSFPIHARRTGIECSPGTFVFWDWGYKKTLPDEPFDFAALVITRVISIIDEQTICLDLGHKSVAAENPFPRVYFLNAPDAVQVSQSEEHLVLQVPNAKAFAIGDVLYGVPLHICPTVALYDSAFVVENNNLVDGWKVVARDRKISI